MRSPIYSQPLAVVGTAKWDAQGSLILPLDYIQLAFGVTCGGILSQDASAITYSYLFTLDDCGPDNAYSCSVSQSTTKVTVTDANLQTNGAVAVGDIARIWGTGNSTVDGWYTIATAGTTTTFVSTSATSQTVAATPGYYARWRLFAAPAGITAATTRASAALAHSTTGPATGLALKATARTAGSLVGVVVQGAGPG